MLQKLYFNPLFFLLCLIFCLLLFFYISGPINITAEPGQTVTLPCQAPTTEANTIDVEWTRPDLEGFVVVLSSFPYEILQHPFFQDRVELKEKQMKDRDVSVILKNLTLSDTGRYECRVKQMTMNRKKRAIIDTDLIGIINLSVLKGEFVQFSVIKTHNSHISG